MNKDNEDKDFLRSFNFEVTIIGIIAIGASIFGFFEGSFFNTYLEHVLHLEYIYISIMVSISALFGLIFLLVFGIISDNTRSERFGRRRPYIFIGGIVAGICMIIYGFSTNYITCFLLDAIIIGVFSNMFYAGQKPLIPDLIDIEHRGRANAIISIISSVGTILPIFLALYVNEVYGKRVGNSTIISQEGHIFILTIGGLSIIIVAIIALIFLRDVPLSSLPPKKRFFEDLKSSFQYEEFLKNKDFFKMIIGLTIFNMGFRVIAPFVFNYIFSLGLSTLTLIFAISIIIPIIFYINYFLGKMADKHGRKKLIMPTILISCIGFFMIPFLNTNTPISLFLLSIAIILVLITTISLQVPLSAWQQDLLPENKRGQFLGILNIVYTISQIPGAILGGLVADAYGLEWIFAVAPIFLLLSIPFFFLVRETLPENVIKD
ncbi:MAG: MFS transporter [Promethearchaeia archaeon]